MSRNDRPRHGQLAGSQPGFAAVPGVRPGEPAAGYWEGFVLVPAIGGDWLLRRVKLPSAAVDAYGLDEQKPADLRSVVVGRIDDWMRDPELRRRWL